MIPSILPPTVATTVKFLKKRYLKCIQVMKDVYIFLLRPVTVTLVIVEVVVVVMLVEVDICHKSPDIITPVIANNSLC